MSASLENEMRREGALVGFPPFLQELAIVGRRNSWGSDDRREVRRLLDGAAGKAVVSNISREARTRDGIFFSGHLLSRKYIKALGSNIEAGASVFDPACGAGDLLVAAAALMPLGENLDETIGIWSRKIGGCDIHRDFVEATRWRLLLLARLRHVERDGEDSKRSLKSNDFSGVAIKDYLKSCVGGTFDCVITNPPYGKLKTRGEFVWGSGDQQLAGIFLDRILRQAKDGQIILAILPDVLRSGSRYAKWRCHVDGMLVEKQIIVHGRFDDSTDVDVFVLCGKLDGAGANKILTGKSWTVGNTRKSQRTLGDFFDVHVGPVVPHRDKELEVRAPYIDVKSAAPGSEVWITEFKSYESRKFSPPFLVVRRTSNPSDRNRLVTTVVRASEPVLVENHLLVLVPKDGLVKSCKAAQRYLASNRATNWVNSQIRCRHLTTKALLQMPIAEEIF